MSVAGGLVEELRPFDRGVAGERFDHGEPLVAGRRRVTAFGLQPVQEREHPLAVEVGEAQLLRWDGFDVAKPGEQQFDRVSVGGDRLRGQVALAGEMIGQEPGKPAAGEIPTVWGDRAHCSAPCAADVFGMTYPNAAWAMATTSG
jgi:hypothetical protein